MKKCSDASFLFIAISFNVCFLILPSLPSYSYNSLVVLCTCLTLPSFFEAVLFSFTLVHTNNILLAERNLCWPCIHKNGTGSLNLGMNLMF